MGTKELEQFGIHLFKDKRYPHQIVMHYFECETYYNYAGEIIAGDVPISRVNKVVQKWIKKYGDTLKGDNNCE